MNKYNYNLEVFYNENEFSYYLLGAYMTDGCIYAFKNRENKKAVSLVSKDKDWLDVLTQYICPKKPLIKKNNCYILSCYSYKIANWLENNGCTQRKSLTLKFPKNIPNKYMPFFIAGCWDGDGSLSFTKRNDTKSLCFQRQANLTSGSLEFCNDLSKFLLQNGIKNSVKEHGGKERIIEGRKIPPTFCYRVVLDSGKQVYNLCKYMYKDTFDFYMPRKYKLAKQIINEWEIPLICNQCKCEINLPHKPAIKPKYCIECKRIKENEKRKIKYHQNKKLF